MTIATFNATAFKVRYPQFVAVNDDALSACFDEAGLYLANTNTSPVSDVTKRTMLLWMLTAHVAYLGGLLSVDGQMQPVGRLSTATEGSVNISLDMGAVPGTAAWFMQTQWGASFWQATSYLRSATYVANPTRWWSRK